MAYIECRAARRYTDNWGEPEQAPLWIEKRTISMCVCVTSFRKSRAALSIMVWRTASQNFTIVTAGGYDKLIILYVMYVFVNNT